MLDDNHKRLITRELDDIHMLLERSDNLLKIDPGGEPTLAIIKEMIHPRTYETWFKPTCAVALSEDVLTLQVPTQFIVDWLQAHHMPMLNQVLTRQCGRSVMINFQVVELSLA